MNASLARLAAPGARGALWMVGSAACFAVMLLAVRELVATFAAIQIVFVRAVIGIVIALPLITSAGFAVMRTRRLGMHALRTAFAVVAMVANYWALQYLTVPDATAILFLIPLFTVVLAATVLGERVDRGRWVATAVGFAGALVLIRPGFTAIGLPTLIMLGSALTYAAAWIAVKSLTRTDSAAVTVFYLNVMMLPVCLLLSLPGWVTPGWSDAPALLVMGVAGWGAHFCQARAFAAADSSAVMPFDFLRLPFAVIGSYLVFAEGTEIWTWIGAAIIFAGAYYASTREARRHRA